MRILCLGMYSDMRGELSYEARMIHHLAAMGNEVDYWTDAPLSYAMEPVLKQPNTLKSFVFHEGKNALAKTPRQFHPLDVRKIIAEHNRVYSGPPKPNNDGYDIIFTTSQTGIDMGVWLKQVLGRPLVVQVLDVPYWRITETGPSEIYLNSVMPLPLLPHEMFDSYRSEWGFWFSQFPQIDRITTILSGVKEYLQQFSGIPAERISTTHHGSIDQNTFDYFLNKETVEKKNQVLCINRIDFHKGVDQTVLVCSLIQDELQRRGLEIPEFVFVSSGNWPWYEEQVKALAKQVLKKHRFTGWVSNPEKIRLIRESRLVIDNEWPEGFGGCMIQEAIYCGVPCLTWDTAGKQELHPLPGRRKAPLRDYVKMAIEGERILSESPAIQEADRKFIAEQRSNRSHAESVDKVLREVVGR